MKQTQQISTALNCHPIRITEPGNRAHAAVAMILEEQPDGLNILFIQRSINANDYWSGQIGFSGGRREMGDVTPRDTTERETWEEIGLDLGTATYLGRLSDIVPGGLKIVVSCFVYAVDQHPLLNLNRAEIECAFWLPTSELNNPARLTLVEFISRGRLRRFPAVRVADVTEQPLWGITYRLLLNLDKVLRNSAEQISAVVRPCEAVQIMGVITTVNKPITEGMGCGNSGFRQLSQV